ncbi:O-antigen polymerase [Denitrovibrio acetiphilus DSM 12809]|uniref:O-antigen polymerase n=1 Tax=Denitrovibrio acetiphilus (strain DSM 12809 / NBRC 114555 / N2460) TaxID=522772 RepID=D4H5Q4_DENA2|nr:O-antigen ligase family protein [Denitrovibrio acetiphilus]ADD69495.1 O-antigen polymerase [Denitrovibrio acetiphilus DSM 12809]
MAIDILLKFGALANPVSISAAEGTFGLIILIAIYKIYKTKDYSVFKKGFFIFFLLMVVAEIISTFIGVNPGKSLPRLKSFWVLLYLPVIYVVFEGRDKAGYLMWLFAGGILTTVFGLYEYFSGKVDRLQGFLTHSLTYGNVAALICITALGLLVMKLYKNKKQLALTVATFLICLVGLVLSGSRGPIFSLLITGFALVVYRYHLKGVVGGIVLIALICGGIYADPQVRERFTVTIDNIHKTESSIGTRLVLWEAASEAIMLRPFFGYGKGNFKDEVSKYINVPTSSRAHAHNSYIQYTFLHGFFGLFALLGFIGTLMWEIYRRSKCSPFIKVGMFVFVVFLLEGLTENNLSDSEVVMTCLSVVGLTLAPGRPSIGVAEKCDETETDHDVS